MRGTALLQVPWVPDIHFHVQTGVRCYSQQMQKFRFCFSMYASCMLVVHSLYKVYCIVMGRATSWRQICYASQYSELTVIIMCNKIHESTTANINLPMNLSSWIVLRLFSGLLKTNLYKMWSSGSNWNVHAWKTNSVKNHSVLVNFLIMLRSHFFWNSLPADRDFRKKKLKTFIIDTLFAS